MPGRYPHGSLIYVDSKSCKQARTERQRAGRRLTSLTPRLRATRPAEAASGESDETRESETHHSGGGLIIRLTLCLSITLAHLRPFLLWHVSRLFPARVLGPERRKSDSREREKTDKAEKGRESHERERETREDLGGGKGGRRAGRERRRDKPTKTKRKREDQREDATVPRQPEKSADDTSSPQSESPSCRWDCLFPSSTNVHSLPNSLSAKQLNTHINTGDCSWRRSSKRSEEVKSERAT